MGSLGANRGSNPISISDRLNGQAITELQKYADWKTGSQALKDDFNLDFATDSQISALRQVIKGILEYDYSYGHKDRPYSIYDIKISRVGGTPDPEELARNKELFGRTFEMKDINVDIVTQPSDESDYIKLIDRRYRSFLIGRNGGYFTFSDKGKRKSISSFDAQYGKLLM